MLYFFLALLILTLPGILLSAVLGIRQQRFLFVVPLSYTFFVVFATMSKMLHWNLQVTYLSFLLGFVILCLWAFAKRSKWASDTTLNVKWVQGLAIVILSYVAYRLWAGPYIELPSDLYRHLEYAQVQDRWFDTGFLGNTVTPIQLFKQQANIWYGLFVLVSHLTGQDLEQSIAPAMLLNGLVFLTSAYAFFWFVLSKLQFSSTQILWASVLSVSALFCHLGINVMAYVRYYALAPTMLNFTLYFASIVLVHHLLQGSANKWRDSFLLIILLFTAGIVHRQEALYILVMSGLMLAWHVLVRPLAVPAYAHTESLFVRWWREVSKLQLSLLVSMALGFLMLVAVAYGLLERPTELYGKVVQWSQQGPILNRILYLNPEFQFIRVITIWGLFSYLLFIIFMRRFVHSAYIFAGMWVPAFTVFNPLFVDFFLRIEGPHTLWRMLFIVPIHVVMGASLVLLFGHIMNGRWGIKLTSLMAVVLVVLLLLPIRFMGFENSYSRITLDKLSKQSSYLLWEDALDFLSQKRPKNILTDPVTGYAISALTHHQTFQYKFTSSDAYRKYNFNFEDYDDKPLAKFSGWWLVLNLRDGAHSEVGELASNHWPADVLKVSEHYAPALQPNLEANPQRFKKIWQADKMAIYVIK